MAKLDLSYDKGKDIYSDGAVEDEILDIIQQGKPLMDVLVNDDRWPILYHLSRDRRNLLEWYPFNRESDLLEIGSGCGALTGLFCEKVARVCAVELSQRRSKIVYNRYKNEDHLKVIAGNIMDIPLSRSFDYVTLVGVLEYSKTFIHTPRPYHDLFKKILTFLKPGGTLFVAVENKFGIKYFTGAREDHTGRLFDGIEGYLKVDNVETFSKDELTVLLQESGYSKIQFYYPYPDYKMPTEIFSDDYQPGVNHILRDAPNFDQGGLQLFSQTKALLNIIQNGKFDFFSNSFLVLASK